MNIGKIIREVEVLPDDAVPDEAAPAESPSPAPEPTAVPVGT